MRAALIRGHASENLSRGEEPSRRARRTLSSQPAILAPLKVAFSDSHMIMSFLISRDLIFL